MCSGDLGIYLGTGSLAIYYHTGSVVSLYRCQRSDYTLPTSEHCGRKIIANHSANVLLRLKMLNKWKGPGWWPSRCCGPYGHDNKEDIIFPF